MNRSLLYLAGICILFWLASARCDGHEYFVDCAVTEPDGHGSSIASAWHTIEAVNAHTFLPGDVIHLKRGTECRGSLWPKGSGSESAMVRLTAYGQGARPKVTAGKGDTQAFKLFNQEYWDVDSIDFSGGTLFGVFVSGDTGILHHIHLRNLVVHDVYGDKLKTKDSGLVVIQPGKAQQHFDDVLVDQVTAYRTNQWVGIMVGGGNFGFPPEADWSTHAIVRNSVVHDVFGDGIVLFRVRDGRIHNSAAWHTGMQPSESTGTPNAIWTWMCTDCVVSQNEAFLSDSPGVDGGAFDIDYGNTRNSVIDNYGHDTQGYCIAVFGAGFVTHDSVVEGNLCINNGKSPRMAFYQGAIFLWTWNDGAIENLRVERNTVYWTPPGNAPALINHAAIKGSPIIFRENQIYSSSPWIVDSGKQISFQNNRYTTCGLDAATWVFDGRTYNSLDQFSAATGQDSASTWTSRRDRPTCLGLAQSMPTKGRNGFQANHGVLGTARRTLRRWAVVSDVSLSVDDDGYLDAASAGELVVLKDLYMQFRSTGLRMTLRFHLQHELSDQSLRDLIGDLDLGDIKTVMLSTGAPLYKSKTSLIAPDGAHIMEWQGFVGPAKLGLAVRSKLGEPLYSQLESETQFTRLSIF
jgi:hypothetical protein